MRFLVLAAMGFLSVVFAGSFAQVLQIAGIPIDLMLLIIVPLALMDRSTMPILFAAFTGLFCDLLYSTVIGMTALAYTAAAAVVFFVCQKADRINFFMVLGAGIGAYLIADIVMGIVAYSMGVQVSDPLQLFGRFIIPGALIEGGLVIPAYWLISKLMRCRFMRKRRIYADEL